MPIITFKAEEHFKDAFPHPIPASKNVPEWFKKMSGNVYSKKENPKQFPVVMGSDGKGQFSLTIKKCPPILDYLCSGYIIPLWTDILVERIKDGGERYTWHDGNYDWIRNHAFEQVKGSILLDDMKNNRDVYKLMSPWTVKTPPGYSCLFFSPRYHKRKIKILPAIVDTDVYHEVNFPFFYTGEDQDMISRGEPIVQVLPFKREEWGHEVETMDPIEIKKSQIIINSFWGKAYKKLFHKKKVFR